MEYEIELGIKDKVKPIGNGVEKVKVKCGVWWIKGLIEMRPF